MNHAVAEVVLWLFTINLGIAFGAGLYEKILIVPDWFRRSDRGEITVVSAAMRHTNSGLRFWAFVTTGPLTLLTLASGYAAWNVTGPWRTWWLAATAITLLERIATFSFFIPTALKLMRADTSPLPRPGATAKLWITLNHLRAALNLAGWLAALRALSLAAA
jgi:hypothetical protein